MVTSKGKIEKKILLGDKFLFYGTTAFLYSAIAATTVALLLEARMKEIITVLRGLLNYPGHKPGFFLFPAGINLFPCRICSSF
jgi:hypothetical protein